MKILMIGDLHGRWDCLNILINKKQPDIIISTGDFGYWPKFPNNVEKIKNKNTKIYFCDGNHEDHWSLRKLKDNEVAPNVFYMKRGSVMEICKKTFMFFGGAYSIDRSERTIGVDWFPEEEISNEEIKQLDMDLKIDIMISHTCPLEFNVKDPRKDYISMIRFSRKALSYLLKQYKPKQWFFGHWHFYKKGNYEGCKWKCLNMAGRTMWWTEWKA